MTLPKYLAMETKFAIACMNIYNNGIQLDQVKCQELITRLENEIEEIDIELKKSIPPKMVEHVPLKNPYKKDGEFTQAALNYIETGLPYSIENGQMRRYKKVFPNMGHSGTLRDYLLSLGWKPSMDPDSWNYKTVKNVYGKTVKVKDASGAYFKTTPKLPKSDKELDRLERLSPHFKLISARLKRSNRLGTLRGYLRNVRPDGRISMGINPCGCNTMRVRHRQVANVPRAEEGKFFGEYMRQLFIVPEGKVMVGCDVSGQEACILAHLLDNEEFSNAIITCKYKVHAHLHQYFTDLVSTPQQMKNVVYAFFYGAGFNKLGSLCDVSKRPVKEKGEEVKKRMFKYVPNLDKVISKLKAEFRQYGGIIGLDGRLIKCRKESDLLNLYCQGNGAIFSKTWTCKYRHELKKKKLDTKHIIFYHDSNTEECDKDIADQVGKIMVDCIKWTSEYYKLNIPFTGVYDIGLNWAESH